MIQRAGLLLQTQDTDRRFSGLSRLYGDDMAQRIRRAHVVVVGIGGVTHSVRESLLLIQHNLAFFGGVRILTAMDMAVEFAFFLRRRRRLDWIPRV